MIALRRHGSDEFTTLGYLQSVADYICEDVGWRTVEVGRASVLMTVVAHAMKRAYTEPRSSLQLLQRLTARATNIDECNNKDVLHRRDSDICQRDSLTVNNPGEQSSVI